jgi:hypothetical protein
MGYGGNYSYSPVTAQGNFVKKRKVLRSLKEIQLDFVEEAKA